MVGHIIAAKPLIAIISPNLFYSKASRAIDIARHWMNFQKIKWLIDNANPDANAELEKRSQINIIIGFSRTDQKDVQELTGLMHC